MKMSPENLELFVDLGKAVADIERTSERLGAVNGSYGWNAAESKVAAARANYDAILNKIKDRMP